MFVSILSVVVRFVVVLVLLAFTALCVSVAACVALDPSCTLVLFDSVLASAGAAMFLGLAVRVAVSLYSDLSVEV